MIWRYTNWIELNPGNPSYSPANQSMRVWLISIYLMNIHLWVWHLWIWQIVWIKPLLTVTSTLMLTCLWQQTLNQVLKFMWRISEKLISTLSRQGDTLINHTQIQEQDWLWEKYLPLLNASLLHHLVSNCNCLLPGGWPELLSSVILCLIRVASIDSFVNKCLNLKINVNSVDP